MIPETNRPIPNISNVYVGVNTPAGAKSAGVGVADGVAVTVGVADGVAVKAGSPPAAASAADKIVKPRLKL